MESFGEMLRALILARHQSLRAFAKAIDMEPTYLSRILNGHVSRPDRPTLVRLAAGLGLSVGELELQAGLAVREELSVADRLPLHDVFACVERDPTLLAALAALKAQESAAVYQRAVALLGAVLCTSGRLWLETWQLARDEGQRSRSRPRRPRSIAPRRGAR